MIYWLLTPFGILGAFFMRWLTPFGVGIYVDTLYYVSAAQNLVAGVGLGRLTGLGDFKPMTHYPPFYSLVLAFFHLMGVPELTTARWISVLAFGLSVMLVGLIVFQRSHSYFFSLFSAILILVSNPILRNFSWAMTEPLYIVLVLFSLLFFSLYLQYPRLQWLVLASIFTSLALLTRYIGLALVGSYGLVFLLNRRLSWQRRRNDLVIFLCVSLIPSIAWLVRNWLVSGTLTNRILDWHPIASKNISLLVKAVNSWGLLPQRLLLGGGSYVFWALVILLAAGSIIWLARTFPHPGKAPALEFVLLLASWSYVTILVVSLFFLDATTPLENRILLPFYVLLLLLLMLAAALLWQRRTNLLRLAVALLCLWLAYFSLTRLDGVISDLRRDGLGYASLQWQNSATAEFVRKQNPTLIYTNDITAIYFLTQRNSVGIPNSSATQADLASMRQNLGQPNSFLVLFGVLTGEFAPLDVLTQDLTLVGSFSDGSVYQSYP